MRKKLVWLFGIVVLALVGLSLRITYINASEGSKYKKQVLSRSQQKYNSQVIPFKRGDITDRNGAVLATSEKVYKIILDCKVVNSKQDYVEPTIKAMTEVLGLDAETIRSRLTDEATQGSQYQIMKINVSIKDKKAFEEYTDTDSEAFKKLDDAAKTERRNVKGVWFEDDYLRVYPLGSTASDVIGFTYTGNTADWGLEGYYNSTLNGINGRQYGYFNSDADVEQTIIDPVGGSSIVSTIDVNIQKTVEKYIQQFMDGMADGPRGSKGAANVGVIVANPNNGEILAMATDSPFDLNNPRDLSAFYSQEEIAAMDDKTILANLNSLWKNFCISDTFEPGSTVKPMTIAAALETNAISSDATYVCDGYEMYGNQRIRCSIYPGAHGTLTLAGLLQHSCNDGLMQIGDAMGPESFMRYQDIFNFGSTTGIDLPGEASGILHDSMSEHSTELASASFGQGYTCTMLQEVAAISSVINGGNYYQPHVVSRILDAEGNVKKNVEPVLLKQTISSDVSDQLRKDMESVLQEGGTGRSAKVDGYSMGGKTGTAQKRPLADKKYLVSFIGFAPLDHPEVVVYVVVDEPNAEYQDDSKYAQYIYKGIMTEILPYLNIFPDEEVTGTTSSEMDNLEYYINQRAKAKAEETEKEGTDDLTLAGTPRDDSETNLNNNQESEGITNDEAEAKNGE